MPLIQPIQPTFSGGEFSASIYPRVDIEKYRTGLKTCRNFFIHPHGGASNRPGTRYVATTRDSTLNTAAIVQEFIFSQTQKYVLEFGDQYVRFYTSGAQIVVDPVVDSISEWATGSAYAINDYVTYIPSGTTVSSTYYARAASTGEPPETYPSTWNQQTSYEEWTPYAPGDLADLRFETSADVIYITHPDYQTRTLSRFGDTDFRLALYAPQDGPFMPENVTTTTVLSSATTGQCSLTASSALFTSDHEGALWKLRHYVEGQTASTAFTSATQGGSISCFTTWRIITHGTWTGKLRVEKSDDAGVTWTILRSFTSVNDFNANTFGTEDVVLNPLPFLVRVNMYEYTSGTCNVDLTTDAFYQDGIAQVDTFHSSTSLTGTVLQTIASTSGITAWSEGSWSDEQGWPGVARFYQDRLCFAGTYGEPMTVWMTVTGNYVSFLRHSPLLDSDSITTTLPSRQLNAINGLIALRRLIVLTSSSEWTVGTAGSSELTPTSVEQRLEGYRGSFGVNPTVVGNEAIYVQSNGKVVRNVGYEFATDGFTGAELNILAKHLFDKWTITDLAYQQDPDSLVWALRDDGKLLAMTYMREQEVVAWSKHDTGSDE